MVTLGAVVFLPPAIFLGLGASLVFLIAFAGALVVLAAADLVAFAIELFLID